VGWSWADCRVGAGRITSSLLLSGGEYEAARPERQLRRVCCVVGVSRHRDIGKHSGIPEGAGGTRPAFLIAVGGRAR
jgi:hypothetical protein